MIYRVIANPSGNGRFAYRVEQEPRVCGVSGEPLFDACRQLKRMGVDPAAKATLFHAGSSVWAVRCPIWAGAELNAGSGRFRPHKHA